MLAGGIIACIVLAVIFLQDVTSRSIWWFLPPLLFAGFVWFRIDRFSWNDLGLNLLFVAGLMAFLILYVRLRFGTERSPFREFFGLGDVLFIVALTPLLDFREFVLFFTAGTFLTLVVHGVVALFRKQATIPYAGYFSLVTLTYLVLLFCGTDAFTYITV